MVSNWASLIRVSVEPTASRPAKFLSHHETSGQVLIYNNTLVGYPQAEAFLPLLLLLLLLSCRYSKLLRIAFIQYFTKALECGSSGYTKCPSLRAYLLAKTFLSIIIIPVMHQIRQRGVRHTLSSILYGLRRLSEVPPYFYFVATKEFIRKGCFLLTLP